MFVLRSGVFGLGSEVFGSQVKHFAAWVFSFMFSIPTVRFEV